MAAFSFGSHSIKGVVSRTPMSFLKITWLLIGVKTFTRDANYLSVISSYLGRRLIADVISSCFSGLLIWLAMVLNLIKSSDGSTNRET